MDLKRFLPTWHQSTLVCLLVFAFGLYLWQFDSFQVGTWTDDAHYIVLAKSILAGHGYGLINSPVEPLPTNYPFGWPLLLAPACALFDCDFQPLKMVSLVFTLANVILVAKGWKYLGIPSELMGLVVAALYALSPIGVKFAGMVMSEPAFTFFVLLGLILIVKESDDSRLDMVSSIGLGIVWMFATYVRTIGVTLVASSILWLVLKKKPLKLALAIVGFIVALTLTVYLTDVDWRDLNNFQGYTREFETHPRTEQSNLGTRVIEASTRVRSIGYFVTTMGETLVPFINGQTIQNWFARIGLSSLPELMSPLVLVLVAIGYFATLWRRALLPGHLFVPIYAAVVIIWGSNYRFLYPILPSLFAYALTGGGVVLQRFGKLIKKNEQGFLPSSLIVATLISLLLLLQLIANLRTDNSLLHTRDFRVGTLWIREHVPMDAVVIAKEPQAIYLYAGRATIELRKEDLPFKELARGKDVYILIAPELEWRNDGGLEYNDETIQVLTALQSGLVPGELVFQDDKAKVRVYHLQRTAALTSVPIVALMSSQRIHILGISEISCVFERS